MSRADTKMLSAKYFLDIWLHLIKKIFLEGQKSISSMPSSFKLPLTNYLFMYLFFCFCYKLSNLLAIIDGYYIQLDSNWTIWNNLAKPKRVTL